jgi:Glutamine synthetase adenylyltransferase
MTFLSKLDVVNDMLASLGESPINDLSTGHPMAATGQRLLNQAGVREQSKSWWFNKELVTLSPDGTGTIYVPTDTLRVDPQDESQAFVQRGRRLYNPFAAASVDKYVFTSPVRCWLVRLVPFEDLPAPAQNLVSFAAQMDFSKAYDGDPAKYAALKLSYTDAYTTLMADHIRNQNSNLLRRRSVGYAAVPFNNYGIIQ